MIGFSEQRIADSGQQAGQNGQAKIINFTDLVAWQKSHKLVLVIYEETKLFPASEQFGLTNQIRRAVASITSNIAEGFSRRTTKDKLHFYTMTLGSLTEVQNQLMIARDVGYTKKQNFTKISDLSTEVYKLLLGLMRSLKSGKGIAQ